MVLMEIVICLHTLVSVERSGAAAGTYMVRLWGTRVKNPPDVLLPLLSERTWFEVWA